MQSRGIVERMLKLRKDVIVKGAESTSGKGTWGMVSCVDAMIW